MKKAVVDGNVYRVISRYFDLGKALTQQRVKIKLKKIAVSKLPEDKIGDYNQALMDFGSLQCKTQSKCLDCPLANKCVAKKKTQFIFVQLNQK